VENETCHELLSRVEDESLNNSNLTSVAKLQVRQNLITVQYYIYKYKMNKVTLSNLLKIILQRKQIDTFKQ
jgi:hypothetical protein